MQVTSPYANFAYIPCVHGLKRFHSTQLKKNPNLKIFGKLIKSHRNVARETHADTGEQTALLRFYLFLFCSPKSFFR